MGTDTVNVIGGNAYWIPESQGWFVDSNYANKKILLGSVRRGQISLRQDFGGGVVSLKKATAIAEGHAYTSNLSASAIHGLVVRAFAGRGAKRDASKWTGVGSAAASGARDGSVVIFNHATFGTIDELDAWSTEIQEDAARKGDVLSQIGYGAGKVGVEAGYWAVGGKVFQAGGKALQATRAARYIAPGTRGARIISGAMKVNAVGMSGAAGYNAGKGISAVQSGDYNAATLYLGRSVLFGSSSASSMSSAIQLDRASALARANQAAVISGEVGSASKVTSAMNNKTGQIVTTTSGRAPINSRVAGQMPAQSLNGRPLGTCGEMHAGGELFELNPSVANSDMTFLTQQPRYLAQGLPFAKTVAAPCDNCLFTFRGASFAGPTDLAPLSASMTGVGITATEE